MYKERNIDPDFSLLDALKKMDILDKKLLIILENDIFIGLLSIGDIQRAIIANVPLNTKVVEVIREDIKIAHPQDDIEEIKQMMVDYRMEFCPMVSEDKKVEKIYFWEDLFSTIKPKPINIHNTPVVIMAGGEGTRLRPLTHIIPKPLIPINQKTIIEILFDQFNLYGTQDFYLTVNYKSDILEYYINELKLPFNINLIKEDKPLGTAGSLKLLEDQLQETFFVNNCDIIIEEDYSEILKYHKENANEITIVAAMKHYPIPYGTIISGEKGELMELTEKPELTFKINSGMYVLEPSVLKEIPNEQYFDITELILHLKNTGKNVGVFPVSEKSWLDIGNWEEYNKILNRNLPE